MGKIDPAFPLVDLHRHLDGSVRLETILDLGRQHNLPLPAWDLESLRPHVQIIEAQPGVMAFLTRFAWMTGVLVDEDACRRIAYENVEDLQREGIDYAELRFSPWFMAEAHRLDPVGVIDALVDGVQAASGDTGVKVNLIGILSRTYGVDTCWKELNAILSRREHFVAVDLAGDEANYPGTWFVEHFKAVHDAGLRVTIHAGESDGAGSVWQAVRELGAERIGHAVHAPEDAALMDYLAKHRIGIEANLTSNVQTSTVPSYAAHPMRVFMQQGLLATLNTDDPGISRIDLPFEYEVAAVQAGLTDEHIRQAQVNGLQVAFLSDREKQQLIESRQTSARQA